MEYIKIIESCRKEAQKKNTGFTVSQKLIQYIDEKNIFIEKRKNLGLEIKHQDEKLLTKFNRYKEIIDNCMVRNLRPKQMWDSFFMVRFLRDLPRMLEKKQFFGYILGVSH